MKQIMVYKVIVFAALILVACSKGSLEKDVNRLDASNSTITGKWNLVYDSAYSGVGINNHPVNYAGQAGDYFDFRPDSSVYIKKGTAMDTLNYSLITDSTIIIASFGITLNGVPETTHIKDLTAHHATLIAPVIITPGGEFGRSVQLIR